MGWRFGVDTGGTFTDVCMFEEETGLIHVWKTISTPEDPSLGIVDVVQQADIFLAHLGPLQLRREPCHFQNFL